jgi:hypothetical protein
VESDTEYEALKKLGKADTRFRFVLYLITLFFFLFSSYQLLAIRQDINTKVDNLSTTAQNLVAHAIREGEIRDKEETRYITCIFLFPIESRTTEIKENCFKRANLPGGLEREDFSPSFGDTENEVIKDAGSN